jgi:hypothetical protein
VAKRGWDLRRLISVRFLAGAVVGLMFAGSLGSFARADSPSVCDSADAASLLDAARAEVQAHRWPAARRAAEAAAVRFVRCAARQRGSDYANSLYGAGSAHLIIGLAIVGEGGSQKNIEFARAYAFFQSVAVSTQSSPLQKKLGKQKANNLRHTFAQLQKNTSLAMVPRPSAPIPPAPEQFLVAPTPSPVVTPTALPTPQPTVAPALQAAIVDAWQTSLPGRSQSYQHVRLHLIANRAITISARSFRIAILVNGVRETVYGYAGAAPSYSRVNWLAGNSGPASTTVASVDPADDLGRSPIALRPGDEVTKVVTFAVPAGSQFNKDDPTSLLIVSGN